MSKNWYDDIPGDAPKSGNWYDDLPGDTGPAETKPNTGPGYNAQGVKIAAKTPQYDEYGNDITGADEAPVKRNIARENSLMRDMNGTVGGAPVPGVENLPSVAKVTAPQYPFERKKEANRQWLDDRKTFVIDQLARDNNLAPEDAGVEFERMRTAGVIPKATETGMREATWGEAIQSSVNRIGPSFDRAMSGMASAHADATGDVALAYNAENMRKQANRDLAAAQGEMGGTESGTWKNTVSNIAPSLAQNLPWIVLTAATRNPTFANIGLAGMGATTFGDAYAEGKDLGLNGSNNTQQALLKAAAEIGPEKLSLNSMMKVLGKVPSPAEMSKGLMPFVKEVAKQQGVEHTTEQMTTALQAAVDKLYTNPDLTLGDWADQAVETFKSTLIQGPLLAGSAIATRAGADAVKRAIDPRGAALQDFANAVEGTNFVPLQGMGPDTAETQAAQASAMDAWGAGFGARRAPVPKTPEQVLTDIINGTPDELPIAADPLAAATQSTDPATQAIADLEAGMFGQEAGQVDQQSLLVQLENQTFGEPNAPQLEQMAEAPAQTDGAQTGLEQATAPAGEVAPAQQPVQAPAQPPVTVTPRQDGTIVVSGEGATEAVAKIVPKASMVKRADGSVLVGATYAPAVQKAYGPPLKTGQQPTSTAVLPHTPAELAIPKAVAKNVATKTDAELNLMTKGDQTPVVMQAVQQEQKRRAAPIMRRDDLVGAIMRVTGGKGLSAGMAQTITGDKAGSGNAKLRGLFTNDGTIDLDDTAELLSLEEGYSVRDGSHLAELVRDAAAGNMTYSMARTEREAAENAEKEYKASVNQKAAELGLKKVGGKRTLAMVEADIAAKEKEISEQEAREERASIQASEIAEDIYQEGSELTEADLMQWLGDRIEYSQDEINEANSRASERESRRVEKNAGDDSQEQAQGSSPEGAGTGATEAGARSTESLTEPTDDLISRAKALGMKTVGVSAEKLTKQVEEAESFNLSKQTNEQAAAEYKRQQEEANKKDDEPAPNVTADQVDMFNTQGSLIDNNREPAQSQQKSDAAPESAQDKAPAITAEKEQSSYKYVRISHVNTPAQGALNNAKSQKDAAWSRLKTLRAQVKDGRSDLRLELIKAESAHKDALRAESAALEQIEKDANRQGLTTVKNDQPLDHGELSIPNRTNNINAELDRYKAQQEKDASAKAKTEAEQKREDKAAAKAALAEYGDAIVEKHGDKLGKRELKNELDQMAKWEPKKLLQLVEKFKKENGLDGEPRYSKAKETIEVDGVDRQMTNSNGKPIAQPSTNAPTLTEADLLPLMGKAMGSETLAKVLLDSGLVTGVRRGADFQGATFEDGRIILNLDALTADNFAGVFKHEGFHSTVKALLGEAKYKQLMKQLESQVGLAKGNAWVDQANAAVPADTKAEHKTEEIAAYAIEQVTNGAKVPNFVQRWVGELLSALRTAIIRFAKADSKLQGWAMQNLKPEDLARLAVAGLRAKARGAMQGQMREAVAYSNAPVGKEIVSSIADMNRILTGKPLALLQTSDAPHLGKAKLREWAVGVFRDYGFYANNKTLGKVLMDERSIRDSIGHSLNPFKAVAFKAVPDVIENGAIVHVERKGDMDSIYISGPVVINGTDDIVTVLVHRDINTQRMYLHSVTTKEGLLRSSQSSADTNVSERSGTVISGGISKILQAALNYNGENGNRYSRAQPPLPGSAQPQPARKPELPADTLARKAQRKIQDKLNRFTVIKEWLAENGVTLSEQGDIYKAEERMHSRFANKAQDFREKRVMPLVQKVQKAGFTMEDVAQFLHANHAEKRNAQIAKVNPQKPDGGSGMTNAEAQAILKSAPAELKAMALEFRAITEDSKQILLKAGVIDRATVDAWEAAYGDTYVPLKGGPDENAAKTGTGKGLSLKHKTKRALGHETRAEGEWIIENILADHERALMAAEKNRVFHSLVKMALETAHLDLITINKPEKRQVLLNHPHYTVRKKGAAAASFRSEAEARSFIQYDAAVTKASRGDYAIEKTNDPSVAMMASPMPGPDEATGYINGQLVRVQFNDPLMAEAYNNMGVEAMNAVLRAGRALNGFFSKIYTGYNPEFIATNVFRDFTTGLANVTGEEGIAMAGKSAKNYAARFLELVNYARTGNETQWIKMYREDGGNTGAAYLSDLERLGSDIQTEYAAYQGVLANVSDGNYLTAARAAGRKTLGKLLHVFEVANMAGENAMRLSVYQSMIESGKSRAEAASMAKNVTVNFNRRGTLSQQANAAYLFFNAGVQGTASLAHAHFKGKHKYQAWAFSSTLVGMGYLLSLLSAGDDEDEYEKIGDYDRERNVIIKAGDGYVKLPIPYGYGFFWNVGRAMADAQRTGEVGKAPWQIATSFVREFTPFGATVAGKEADGKQAFLYSLPTVFQIVGAPLINKTSFGTPMIPENGFDKHQPDREKMNRGTRGTLADDLAGALESAGFDVSPETLKFAWRTGTGGAGTTATSIVDGVKLKAQGADLDIKEMPFVRKFYTETDVRGARARYYEAKDEADKALSAFNRARKAKDFEKAGKIMAEQQEMIALARLANAMQKSIKAARDRIDSVRLSGEYTKAEERLIIKQMEIDEAKLYDQYIAQFKERTKK